mmetsp:Transcript_41531/g.72978  ORF Transcript_41531/g.72978 Transcript_41531/m.72978 type:complete len:148 (-) Transcript_41531:92-535(-)
MAGHAEKKQAKKAANDTQYYLLAIVIVNVLYFVWRVMLNYSSFGFWNKVGCGLFLFVSYFTYKGIDSALQSGMDFEYYQDIYLINLTTQFFVTFSNWGWLLYLTVPGFLGYKIVKMLLSYVFTPTAEEMAENDPRAKKRQEKKRAAS